MSESGERLDHLRIPFDKIKFGKKLKVQVYGTVFEGEYDDQQVALKQLYVTNRAKLKPKLLEEILTISRFQKHPNLVAFLGFCDEKSNKITLVYEYVASGKLVDVMRNHHNTIERLEICLGAARGLEYLHTSIVDPTTPGLVHGNINLSKILLSFDSKSSKFVAKVSGFGLSKIVPGKAHRESMDDEKPTKMADVYSFGVILLQMLCGVSQMVEAGDYQKRHVTELVPKNIMEEDKLSKIVHHDIRNEIKTEALETYARIACQCVINDPQARPTMAQVVQQLEKAFRLQNGKVSDVDSDNEDYSLPNNGTTDEDTEEMVDDTKTMSSLNTREEYSKITQEISINDNTDMVRLNSTIRDLGNTNTGKDDLNSVLQKTHDTKKIVNTNGNLTSTRKTGKPQGSKSKRSDSTTKRKYAIPKTRKKVSNISIECYCSSSFQWRF